MEQRTLDLRLVKAAGHGELEMVQKLLAKGADIHAWADNALLQAADHGHLEVVKYLLVRDGEKADIHGSEQVLLRAIIGGYVEIAKYLLEKGADVHARNDAALRDAVYVCRKEIVKVLATAIFDPESWRGKSRAEIEAYATALYESIKADYPEPDEVAERLQETASVLADCAIDCWHRVRPIPELKISPLPAQP